MTNTRFDALYLSTDIATQEELDSAVSSRLSLSGGVLTGNLTIEKEDAKLIIVDGGATLSCGVEGVSAEDATGFVAYELPFVGGIVSDDVEKYGVTQTFATREWVSSDLSGQDILYKSRGGVVSSEMSIAGPLSVQSYLTVGTRNAGSDIGENSVSEGSNNIASGNYSHAEGVNAFAGAYASHAEGDSCSAYSRASHAEGRNTIVSGLGGHAEGYETRAGANAHAEGYGTSAIGSASHAAGRYAAATNINTWIWNGDNSRSFSNPYTSTVSGSFNINPVNGISGFFIGTESLSAIIRSSVEAILAEHGITGTV